MDHSSYPSPAARRWRLEARKKVYSSEPCLVQQVPPVATGAAVHLQQHSLPLRVLQVRIKRHDGVVNIFIKLLIVHATLLVHADRARPHPLLFTAKPALCAGNVAEEVELKLLAILGRHGRWELPMYRYTLPCCIASENASAAEGGFRCRPLRKWKVRVVVGDGRPTARIRLAAVKRDLRLVDVDNLTQRCLRD